MKLSSIAVLSASILIGAISTLASAQSRYDRSDDYVTVYEHCDFEGKSQSFAPGDYSSLREAGFGNDKMSSIRVPRGSEVVIYEDDDFRGPYARINRDIRCFDKRWNDEVSSMQVNDTGYGRDSSGRGYDDDYRRDSDRRNNNRRGNDRRNDRYDNGGFDGRDYGNRTNRRNDSNVTAKNVSKVVFDGVVLQQIDKKKWRMNSARGGVSQFKEVERDRSSVYLQNDYTAQRVRIDLFANDVTFVNRNGRQQRYNIDRKQASLNTSRPTITVKPPVSAPSSVVRGSCFNYKAYTLGGEGGIRFHTKEGFFRFTNKAHTGRICHDGPLTMEINKVQPGTDVIVEIQGNKHRFSANEKADLYKNNWYRKRITLKVGG